MQSIIYQRNFFPGYTSLHLSADTFIFREPQISSNLNPPQSNTSAHPNSNSISPKAPRKMSDVNKIFREDESDSGSRIRKISTEDATKALRWINEQEELNSASYLSRGRNADDMSSSWDLHSSTPSVAYVPSNLMQKQGPPGTQQQQQPGGYPYGTGQRPGVFAGFLNPGSGDQEDPNIDQTQQKAMPLPTEQSPAGAAAAAGKDPPNMSRAITFNNSNSNSNSNSKNSTQKPTDEPIGYYSWLEYLIYPALAIAIQIIFGRGFAFPDGLDRETGRACISTEGFNSQTPNANMCGLEDTLQTAQAQVRILTPFILAGFVLTTIYLWLGRRQSYQALCSTLKHINMHLASLLPLPVDVTEDESRRVIHARKTLTRWSLLAYELAVLKARGLMDVDAYAIPHLKHFGLLVEGEWEAMVPGDRHTTVLLWMQTKAVKLGNEKIIDPSIHVQTICQAVSLLRDKTNDLMSSLSCDSPIPYTSIVGVLVRYTLLLQAAWKGVVSWYMVWG